MIKSALAFLALLFSTIGLSQTRATTDSLDRIIRKGFKKTTRIDDQRDSVYSIFFFGKKNGKLLVAIVSSKQTETTYNFINEELVRVRIVIQFPGETTRGLGKYYFLSNTLINLEESKFRMADPMELLQQANMVLTMAKAKFRF